jgi:thiamine-phosphate pyrophosphorylase
MKNALRKRLQDALVYWVYDRDLSLKQDADGRILCELLSSGLVDLLQFRAKGISESEYDSWVRGLLAKMPPSRALVLANDFVQTARALDLDGVHLGADDMRLAEARAILGEEKLVGLTARSYERATGELCRGADYLGVGTVFETTTKQGLKARGAAFVAEVKAAVPMPVFPIGGINSANAAELAAQGIRRVAVASNLLYAASPLAELKKLRAALG